MRDLWRQQTLIWIIVVLCLYERLLDLFIGRGRVGIGSTIFNGSHGASLTRLGTLLLLRSVCLGIIDLRFLRSDRIASDIE